MRTKDRHLKLRGETYQFVRRVPVDVQALVGRKIVERSLKTRHVHLARELRDEIDAQLEREWAIARRSLGPRLESHPALSGVSIPKTGESERRARKHDGVEVTPTLDDLVDQLDRLASEHADGPHAEDLDAARDFVIENTEEGERLHRLIQLWQGNASYTAHGEDYLRLRPDLRKHTKTEYRRAFKLADEHRLPPVRQLSRADLKTFANALGESLSAPQVSKLLGAIRGLHEHLGGDVDALRRIKVRSVKPSIGRQKWQPDQLSTVLRTARQPWLIDAVAIALYTGARQGAIAGMKYDAEKDWILFLKAKAETVDRCVPCPDAIRERVKRWVSAPMSASSISNRFTETKQEAGFNKPEHQKTLTFHSLRHMTLSRLNDLGVPLHLAQRIAGHKGQSMTYDYYGNKGEVEALREHINKLDWSDIIRTPSGAGRSL